MGLVEIVLFQFRNPNLLWTYGQMQIWRWGAPVPVVLVASLFKDLGH